MTALKWVLLALVLKISIISTKYTLLMLHNLELKSGKTGTTKLIKLNLIEIVGNIFILLLRIELKLMIVMAI